LTNEFSYPSVLVDIQSDFLPIKPLDQKVIAVKAQHFALDGLDAVPGFFLALHDIRLATFPISAGVGFHTLCRLRGIGQTQAQHDTTRDDTDDFGNRNHGDLLG
jgi:hypothetical protein